jgi:Fe2+ transport system protein FeoA
MKKSNTLLEFKQKVASMFNLNIHEFTVKRNMVNRELKNLNAKLSEIGLTGGANVKIEKGKAHKDGVFEI